MDWSEEWDHALVYYSAVTSGRDDAALDAALDAVREKVRTDVLPRLARDEWDAIRIEFWEDSGRLIVIPELPTTGHLSEKARCELRLEALTELWASLESRGVDDVEFATRIRAENERYAKALVRVWASATNSARGGQMLRIRFFEADDETPFLEEAIPADSLS